MKLQGKHIVIGLAVFVILGCGIGVGYFIGVAKEQNDLGQKLEAVHPFRGSSEDYKFIDPLLYYMVPQDNQDSKIVALRSIISSSINSNKQNGNLIDGSVYLQDLNTGKWIGVNQNNQYNPASMLKVVIMVAYFKSAESNPGLLNRLLPYTQDINDSINQVEFKSQSDLTVGGAYAVGDLINKMIIDSDNGAERLLLMNVDQNALDDLYSVLNIDNPDTINSDYTISPRQYSFFFRILYNGTYLDDADSEKALSILSQATFKDGLVAGISDANIAVAHKYGEYAVVQGNQVAQVELHDCGIVYYPKSPYLICVMTRGQDLNKLEAVIKSISSLVYKNYSQTK